MKVLDKLLYAPRKCWEIYSNVRDSPETIGRQLKEKLFTISIYLLTLGAAIGMVSIVFNYQAVFSAAYTHRGGNVEIPSLILCPEKSTIYKYSFIHDPGMIRNLSLSVEAINILAKAASTKSLKSKTTREQLTSHVQQLKEKSPEKLWEAISHGMYRPETYNFGVLGRDGEGYQTKDDGSLPDLDCVNFNSGFLGYHCMDVEDLWLTDNSYCLFWNNTGKELDYYARHMYEISMDIRFPGVSEYRFWLGNLLTVPIRFQRLKAKYLPFRANDVSIYRINKTTQSVCQTLINNDCEGQENHLDGYWVFNLFTTESDSGTRLAGTKIILRISFGSLVWYEVADITRLTPITGIEATGNMLGIWTGLSLLAMGKTAIAGLKLKLQMRNFIVIIFQAGIFIVLVGGTITMQYMKFSWLKDNQYLNEMSLEVGKGVPYPEILLCFRFLASFNKTFVEEQHISWKLLKYIKATATLEVPENYLHRRKLSKHFLFDKNATAELGYHWSFLQFPLQDISNELYEHHMSQVEEEYANLAEKLGLDANKPSYSLLNKLSLDPCKFIKYCMINGKPDESCCLLFKPSFSRYKPLQNTCYKYKSDPNRKQTRPGKEHGFLLVLDQEELQTHTMDTFWYDDFLKAYAKNCTETRNCFAGFTGGWDPGSAIMISANHGIQDQVFFRMKMKGRSTQQIGSNIAMHVTNILKLEANQNNKCSDKGYPKSSTLYRKHEFVKQVCGCYACLPEPIYQGQTKPCCSPKTLGRCLTRRIFYESQCKCKDKTCSKLKHHPSQNHYAGNLPNDFPTNPLVYRIKSCKALSHANTTYHKLFMNLDQKILELKSCKFTSIQVGSQEFVEGNATELVGYNFFFPLNQIQVFQERDLINRWEIIGLVCGALGICFGVTMVNFFEVILWLLLFVKNRLTKQDFDSELSFVDMSLKKFLKRFRSILLKNEIEEKDRTENNKIYVMEVSNHESTNDDPEAIKVIPGSSKSSIPKNIPNNTGTGSNAENPKQKDSSVLILFLILCAGTGLAIYSCFQLHETMELDNINIQFDISEKGLAPPSLGVCISRKDFNWNQHINLTYVLHYIEKCWLKEIPVECSKVFAIMLRSSTYDCAVSIYETDGVILGNSFVDKEDLKVFVSNEHQIHIWTGDIKAVAEGIIDAQLKTKPNEWLEVKYKQWQSNDMIDCADNDEECWSCSRGVGEVKKLDFCCVGTGIKMPNITGPPKTRCTSSIYDVAGTFKKAQNIDRKTTIITLKTEMSSKLVFTRQNRRTISEQFMLYAGYIDLFFGVNVVNMISISGILLIKFVDDFSGFG